MANEGKVKKLAKQCYYYGCAGTMICTYYSWTTSCTYPKCNKKDLSTNKSAYEATKKNGGIVMEAKELMIGDWVQVPSELNRVRQIRSTFDLDEAVLYQAIPLTAEILEKNGFLSCDSPAVKMYGGFGKYYRPYRYLRYVHELQHALKLCGITKEIII